MNDKKKTEEWKNFTIGRREVSQEWPQTHVKWAGEGPQ